ncbi:MAG: hypothetical protein U0892_00405 [Pirellulales bacterium]
MSCCAVSLFLGIIVSDLSLAQEPAPVPPASSDDVAVQRYLELLIKRPSTGTALDKVVEYYSSANLIEQLCRDLEKQADAQAAVDASAAASRRMAVGFIRQASGQWEPSLRAFAAAMNESQLEIAARTAAAESLKQLHRWPEVSKMLEPLLDESKLRRMPRTRALECLKLAAAAEVRSERADEARKLWTRLEKLFTADASIRLQIAEMAVEEGELEFAIETLTRALAAAKQPQEKIDIELKIGDVQSRLGQYDVAQNDSSICSNGAILPVGSRMNCANELIRCC